jgi:hypothetical protein
VPSGSSESGCFRRGPRSEHHLRATRGSHNYLSIYLGRGLINLPGGSLLEAALSRLHIAMGGSTPGAITARMKSDVNKWSPVVAKANIPKLNYASLTKIPDRCLKFPVPRQEFPVRVHRECGS